MRTHERVLAQIEADLRSGKWVLGERLPGERTLAEQMGVSRPSVREAIRVLEAMGIVKTAVGSGPEAGATVIDRPAAGLGAAVRLHVASGTLPVEDVVATRAALETWAVREAAARAEDDEEGIADAQEKLESMDEEGLSREEFLSRDQDFHIAIGAVGGNQLVEAICIGLRSAVGSYVLEGANRLPDFEATKVRLCAEHKAIFDAVAAGDGATAEKLAYEHIWGFYELTGLAHQH